MVISTALYQADIMPGTGRIYLLRNCIDDLSQMMKWPRGGGKGEEGRKGGQKRIQMYPVHLQTHPKYVNSMCCAHVLIKNDKVQINS